MDSSTRKQVSLWILEFLIRNPNVEDIAKRALSVLPFPDHEDDDPRLKRTVLLRTIDCELSDASLTESTLEALELIDDLDSRQGLHPTRAIGAAYCAVAVECTVRLLVGAGGKPGPKYLSALKSIWRDRVCRLESEDGEKKSPLLTSDLRRWRDEVEAAIWDYSVCEKLVGLNTRNDALASVRVYLKEAWALAGKSVISWAVRLMDEKEEEKYMVSREGKASNRGLSLSDVIELAKKVGLESLDGDVVDDDDHPVRNEVVVLSDSPSDLVLNHKEIHGAKVVAQNKRVALHRRHRGPVRISDIDDSDKHTSSKNYDSLLTPEVIKVQESLKSSCLELQTIVLDPLPEALQVAETVISSLATKNVIHQHPVGNQSVGEANICAEKSTEPTKNMIHQHPLGNQSVGGANICVGISTEPMQSRDDNLSNPTGSHQIKVPQPSLMDHNSIAYTQEWNNSINEPPKTKLMGKTRVNLPTSKKRVVSPLSKYEAEKLSKRRKVRRWSLLEEETLRNGVWKFGKGNWKLILNSNCDIFEERTEVDLKDKWRNMTK